MRRSGSACTRLTAAPTAGRSSQYGSASTPSMYLTSSQRMPDDDVNVVPELRLVLRVVEDGSLFYRVVAKAIGKADAILSALLSKKAR